MKKLSIAALLLVMALFAGCKDDDKTTNTTVTDPIVGTWVCQGTNVPYGLRVSPFRAVKITATFNANKSYTVVQVDSFNVSTTFTGTYTNTASTYTDTASASLTKTATIYNIVANQSTPSAVTSTGIYAVKDNNMSYEIIQTTPAIANVTAPTAAEGFGSTKYGTTKLTIYIQKYVKQ